MLSCCVSVELCVVCSVELCSVELCSVECCVVLCCVC